MVGGSDFNARPFNLATNGHRQPGSAFKPFILVRALDDGIDPNSTWASQPKTLYVQERARPEGEVRRVELRRLLLRDRVAVVGHGELGQLRLRRARHEGEAAARGARLAQQHGHPHQGLHQPVDDARRPEGGRHAARDGLRLLDDRQRRRAHLRERSPPTRPGRWRSERSSRATGRSSRTTGRKERVLPRQGRPGREGDAWARGQRAAPARPRRSATSSSGARPAPPRTTATPGSWAATTT